MDQETAFKKISRYCAYQDRCHKDVRSKLLDMGIVDDDLERLIEKLIRFDFLNEERFARSFSRGKHRMNRWGRMKIVNELQKRDISDYCIRKAMEELNPDEYQKGLESLAWKYIETRKNNYSRQELYNKAHAHLFTKGYESDLIKKVLSKMI